jgi:hypothetical protein
MRVFFNATREPHTVMFREPHPGDSMGAGQLAEEGPQAHAETG